MSDERRIESANALYTRSFTVCLTFLGLLTALLFYLPRLQSEIGNYGFRVVQSVNRERILVARAGQLTSGLALRALEPGERTSRRLTMMALQLENSHFSLTERRWRQALYGLPPVSIRRIYDGPPDDLTARISRFTESLRALAASSERPDPQDPHLVRVLAESAPGQLGDAIERVSLEWERTSRAILTVCEWLAYGVVALGWGILAWMYFGILHPLVRRLYRSNSEQARVNSLLISEIARRMRIEADLAQQREEQRVIFDAVPAMIWYKDSNNRILRANRLAAASIGRRVEEVEGRHTAEFYPEEAEKYLADDLEVIRTGRPKMGYLEAYPALDGSKRWVETYKLPFRNLVGQVSGVVVFAIDVTDKKRAEDQLRQLNETLEQRVRERTDLLDRQSRKLIASEEGLRRQTSILRSVLNSMSDGVVVADEQLRFLLWNSAAERIAGIRLEEGRPGTWSESFGIYRPDGTERMPDRELPLVRAARGESCSDVELLIRNEHYPEGVYVSCSARPLQMEDGSLGGGVVVFRDVTPHRRADEAIRLAQRQQQAILNNIPDIAWLKDTESRYVMVNEPFLRACGLSADELPGKTDFDLWPEDLAEQYRSDDREVMQTGRHKLVEEPFVDAQGVRSWIETIKSPIVDVNGRVIGTTGIAREITQRKLVQEALRESREYLDKIINNVADPIFVKDREHRWVLLNDAMCRLFGHPRETLLGKSDYDFFPKDEADVFWAVDDQVLKSGKENTNEEYFTDARGTRHTIITRKSLYVDKQGHPYVVGVIRDVTELKNAQAEVLQKTTELAQLNAEREQLELFAFVASHDLQEPLQKIIGFGDLLRLHLSATMDDKSRQYLDRVQEAARRLSRLIDDLFAFSKITLDQQEMEPIDLSEVFKDVLQDLEHRISEKRARVDVHKLPCVQADRVQMYELFKNLVGNAIKFSKPDLPPHVIVRSELRGRHAHIQVVDNGIGFDEKYREQIFRPFERLHRRDQFDGSGIGLAICQKIALRHRGRIEAEGRPGRGSTFTVTLPIHAQGAGGTP